MAAKSQGAVGAGDLHEKQEHEVTDVSNKFEDGPRWRGAPLVCVATNMMAFNDEKAVESFRSKNCPLAHTESVKKCESCGMLHAEFSAIAPSGHTSGTTRMDWKHKVKAARDIGIILK